MAERKDAFSVISDRFLDGLAQSVEWFGTLTRPDQGQFETYDNLMLLENTVVDKVKPGEAFSLDAENSTLIAQVQKLEIDKSNLSGVVAPEPKAIVEDASAEPWWQELVAPPPPQQQPQQLQQPIARSPQVVEQVQRIRQVRQALLQAPPQQQQLMPPQQQQLPQAMQQGHYGGPYDGSENREEVVYVDDIDALFDLEPDELRGYSNLPLSNGGSFGKVLQYASLLARFIDSVDQRHNLKALYKLAIHRSRLITMQSARPYLPAYLKEADNLVCMIEENIVMGLENPELDEMFDKLYAKHKRHMDNLKDLRVEVPEAAKQQGDDSSRGPLIPLFRTRS